jgi:aryl-phospho-beta-D-glucosidase BglC (GH1 family)
MERYVVNGLDEVDMDVMSKTIADQGFNCVRLPYSLEQYWFNYQVADDAVSANPQLRGLTVMEVFDRTVLSLTNAGVAVILNNHISDAMWCCGEWDENGLWYNARYSADMWLETVTEMSARYSDNLLVIGNDLRNEIRADRQNNQFASWGDGGTNDWKAVATEAGN